MKISEEKRGLIKAHLLKRTQEREPTQAIGSVRVDLVHLKDVKHEMKARGFTFYSDESAETGGTNSAPNPLSYFLAGALSCLMNQYVRLAVAEDIKVEELEATARGHFERRVGGGFTRIIYDIRIKSPEGTDKIRELAEKAELYCYAHNTLAKAVKMETNLYHNGQLVMQK